jgi:hypothetical protein
MSQATRPVSRRTLFAGAATVGAAAAAVSVMPPLREAAEVPTAKPEPPPRGGGYQLSEHVRRYFKTTRI